MMHKRNILKDKKRICEVQEIKVQRFRGSRFNVDNLVKSPKSVMPAKAGIQNYLKILDSRLRGNDVKGRIKTFYDTINFLSSIEK